MRCKKCGFIKKNNITKVMCWREWQLCSICAVEEHPKSYTYMQQKSILSKRYDWAKSDRLRKPKMENIFGL